MTIVHSFLFILHSLLDPLPSALVVAYAYHPNAKTLFEVHINNHGRQSNVVPERTIWSYVVQIANAIKAVHEAGQAVRTIDITKVLLTGKNRLAVIMFHLGVPTRRSIPCRIRISCCGIIDVLTYGTRQDIPSLQQEDLSMFGSLIFALCCNNAAAAHDPQKAMESLTRLYSVDVRKLIHYLISEHGHKVRWSYLCETKHHEKIFFENIAEVFELIGGRLQEEMDEAQKYATPIMISRSPHCCCGFVVPSTDWKVS